MFNMCFMNYAANQFRKDPKEELILATEQVLATGGIDAATVRTITGVAGLNGSAVNYHFGSRDDLFAVICSRRMQPANQDILAELDRLENSADPICIEDVFRPLVETAFSVWVNDDVLRTLRSLIFVNPVSAAPSTNSSRIRASMRSIAWCNTSLILLT